MVTSVVFNCTLILKNREAGMGEIAKFIGYAVIVLIVIGWLSDKGELGNEARCEVLNSKAVPDIYTINDEPDAGYTVRGVIANRGKNGIITIKAVLSTSEGSWERTQQLNFGPNLQSEFAYQFHEPTINATNVVYSLSCSPTRAQ